MNLIRHIESIWFGCMSGRAKKWTGFISRLILFLMTDTARDYKTLTTADTNCMDDLFETDASLLVSDAPSPPVGSELDVEKISMARLTLPSRLELKSPAGSFKAAPL